MSANVDSIIAVIASQEAGLASLTQVEVNRANRILYQAGDIASLNAVNSQIIRFLRLLIKKEILLELLLDEVLDT